MVNLCGLLATPERRQSLLMEPADLEAVGVGSPPSTVLTGALDAIQYGNYQVTRASANEHARSACRLRRLSPSRGISLSPTRARALRSAARATHVDDDDAARYSFSV
jgi:hypothetical protein